MKIALPTIDNKTSSNLLAAGLNANGYICLYDTTTEKSHCMKTSDLADNMGELLPALQALNISVIITRQVHPMALRILVNNGFEVYQAIGNNLDENIKLYTNKQLFPYSHEASMELATVCGGECTTCSTDVCDEEKKRG